LQCEDTLRGGHIILEGHLWLLDDADVVAILHKNVADENVVDAFPARTICSGAVKQNNISDATVLVLCSERTEGQQQ
jgi:hypothetical protein